MGTFTITAVTFMVCLVYQCFGEVVQVHHFRLVANGFYLPNGFAEYPDVSRIICIGYCAKHPVCFYVSYNTDTRACRLSARNDNLTSVLKASNWNLYEPDQSCPSSDEDFITVGNHSLAMCSRRLQKAPAKDACAGFGRILQIRTVLMFEEIHSYLMTLPPALVDLYDDMWVAGKYENSTWKFPGGDPLPLTSATVYDMDGSSNSNCVQLDPGDGYLFDDKYCDAPNSYICERL